MYKKTPHWLLSIFVTAGTLSTLVLPAKADPCADYRLDLDRGYVYNCGHQYRKMIVDDPTGTPLNVRAYPNGPINRQLANGSVIWMDITSTKKELGSDSNWVYVAKLVCDYTCVLFRGVVYAPYLVRAKP